MKDFKKYYLLPAPPEEVYMAITNPKSIALWTCEEADMSTVPGSEFSIWNGSIVGKNIAFVENKKIVQQWYFEGQVEESIVTIILHEHKNGTSVELKHTNIPDADYSAFVDGWDESYFGSLMVFFED